MKDEWWGQKSYPRFLCPYFKYFSLKERLLPALNQRLHLFVFKISQSCRLKKETFSLVADHLKQSVPNHNALIEAE